MDLQEFTGQLNNFAAAGIPFFFIADFELRKPFVCRLEQAADNGIFYDIQGESNRKEKNKPAELKVFRKFPIDKAKYYPAFEKIKFHLDRGDTYLLNLTFPTRIETNLPLTELYDISPAPYKLLYKNEFLSFSPECFIKIINDRIFSYPMKGTIDASISGAEEKILGSKKEIFEHNTIVDLIRNDLSIAAENVKVTKFRYIDKIHTNQKDLLQVSSEITGRLKKNWRSDLAGLLLKMLPAGSVSGAPKQKTIEIIRNAEQQERGYYTGVYGIFDGSDLDSAVNIRYIEKTADCLQFRSGGGITALSDPENEYIEMINKVYVPAG